MGTDLHLYVERKVADKWVAVFSDSGHLDWDTGRHYYLFAHLAGVRNGGGITPWAEPKGLPAGLSAEVRSEADVWEGGSHSSSWYLISEFDNIDWPADLDYWRVAIVDRFHRERHNTRLVFWFD